MEEINWLDLVKQAEDAGRPPAAGPHPVRIDDAEWAIAQTSGNKMIKLKLRITDGADANKVVWDRLVLKQDSPNALMFTFNKMRTLGVDPSSFAGVPESTVPKLFVGKQAIAVLKTDRVYNGTPQADVDSYAPLGAALPTAAAPPPVAAAAPAVAAAPPVLPVAEPLLAVAAPEVAVAAAPPPIPAAASAPEVAPAPLPAAASTPVAPEGVPAPPPRPF